MKVLVTDKRHDSLEVERKVLEPFGVDVCSVFSATEQDLIRNGKGSVGFLVSYAPITRRVMEALPELRVIVKYGVGVDNIDLQAARELNKFVAHVPDYCVEEVALHSLSLALNALRMTHHLGNQVRAGNWMDHPHDVVVFRPSLRKLGLLGLGRIGRRFAELMEKIVKEIHFFDPHVNNDGCDSLGYHRAHDVRSIFEECQIVSIHAPLTAETEGLVDYDVLSRAEGTILVNTSRAGIIDKKALACHLDNGKVIFYGCDVYWEEPPDYSDPWNVSFLERRNVLVTPHLGWYSMESNREVRKRAAEEIVRVFQGEKPLYQVGG